ncbi:ABC transporter substrate-binding protein [Pseudoalteromonas luteoviolacea]|uniref:ABC transporter substrate-binding protein n=1 Tax=Pseudoalteromonas luteoviolacea TaxID=43657 RepID=UPI001B3864FD|nr:ABC transporter substrate-binding protein [Pseudoalteromonas luteoviolacea]MBQ4835089.1 ABC transporter substrate-binding protein [Pseudoalteromonas luteoviolacea]
MSPIKVVFLLLVMTLSWAPMAKSNFSVLFVNPSLEGEPFWGKVQKITEEAAAQLDINIDVIYGDGNRHIQLAELKKYLDYRASPDYVILMLYPGGAEQTLSMLNNYGIKFITLEQTITGLEKEEIGIPKKRFEHWLGEVYFDNYQAGYDLARALHLSVVASGHKGQVNGLAINGHYGSESDKRNQGAAAYFREHKINLQQTVHASWSKEQAYSKTKRLFKRYPDTHLIWSASDLMAMGAQTAVRQLVKDSSKKVAIGGFDWLSDSLSLIDEDILSASVGGHFMMGGWALVSLFDFHHGVPYWLTNSAITFNLSSITKDNVNEYLWISTTPDWSKVNYRGLSILDTKIKEYDFSPNQLRQRAETIK